MAVAAADNPNKYLDPAAFAAMVQTGFGGDEAATRRSLTQLGYNLPPAEPAMEAGKDPLVQDFLDMIARGNVQPPAEEIKALEESRPPWDVDPLKAGLIEPLDAEPTADAAVTRAMQDQSEVAKRTSLVRPEGDKPSPFGGSFIQNLFKSEPEPLKETAQLLEEKPEVKEKPVDETVEVEVDEEPGFMASQPIDFKTNYTQAVKTNILNPEAQAAVQKAIDVAQAQYEFFDKNHDIKIDIDALTKNIDKDITLYTNKIDEIAQEEISPPFEGDTIRKVLAVIGAALGAAASTFGGTPNYALQIIDKAIDR